MLGGNQPIARGEVIAEFWAGDRPFQNVTGAQVVFPQAIIVQIVDGVPEQEIDLMPTAGVCCVRWRIRGAGSTVERFTEIPATGPVDFGALTVVDPHLYSPVDPTPSLLDYITQVAQNATADRF
jgi:hypothetical protein